MVNRAVPPGSMRYFSLLYAPADKRAVLTALYIVAAEIRESAFSVNHDVAHTRLGWWHEEIQRSAAGTAQHPATRVLAALRNVPGLDAARLQDLVFAASMDLANTSYATATELDAYLERSGATMLELAARWLLFGRESSTPVAGAHDFSRNAQLLLSARGLGTTLRHIEILRDRRHDVLAGRNYLPIELTDRVGAGLEELRAAVVPDPVRRLLAGTAQGLRARREQQHALLRAAHPKELRPILVLSALYGQLLNRIISANFASADRRTELGSFEKPWIAWREARAGDH
jgi:phytoene synthase